MLLPYKGGKAQLRRWIIACVFIALVDVVVTVTPLGDSLAKLSFDVPFMFRGNISDTNVVVVLEDRATLDALGEKQWPPSRTVHARLVDKLREEGARLVVFDILFRDERPGADEVLATAIKRHGKVILGGAREVQSYQVGEQPGARLVQVKPPTDSLRTNAAVWGLVLLGTVDPTFGVRKLMTGWKEYDTVVWLAAQRLGALPSREDREMERWINFYGPSPAVDTVTLGQVLELDGRRLRPGFLRGKTVFVGFDPSAAPATGAQDVFGTPYTRFGRDFSAGVEVLANACANLLRGDWLRRVSTPVQLLLAMTFVIGGFTLLLVAGRRWRLVAVVAGFYLVLAAVTLLMQWQFGVWWNWLVPALLLMPMAILLAVVCPRLPMVAFVSYRRKNGKDFALAVRHSLQSRGFDVFLDVVNLGAGKFPLQLQEAIVKTPNFILILSPDSLDERPDDERDFMRLEVLFALQHKKRIIPVMIDGFDYPKALPAGLKKLCDFQAIVHHHDNPDATFELLKVRLVNTRLQNWRKSGED